MLATRQLARDGVSALLFKLRGASDDKSAAVRDRILGAVTGMRQEDLVALNAEVLPRLLDKIRPEARRLLDLHRHAGRATYIVSASPVEIVEPLATTLGMTGGIGTRSVVVDGVYTGELDGPFCYGPGKVEAMREVARWEGLDLAQCYAYSDSASDLPMLEAVGHPVAVNPDATLGAPRSPTWLADRPLQPAHEGGDPPGRRRRGGDGARPPPGSPAASATPASPPADRPLRSPATQAAYRRSSAGASSLARVPGVRVTVAS